MTDKNALLQLDELRSKYANGLTGAAAHHASDEAAKDVPLLCDEIERLRLQVARLREADNWEEIRAALNG